MSGNRSYGSPPPGGGGGTPGGYGGSSTTVSGPSAASPSVPPSGGRAAARNGYGRATPPPAAPPRSSGGGVMPGQGGGRSGAARVRKARLRLSKVDPWSVMKISFVLSIALAIVTVVAVVMLWMALNALGVFSSLQKTFGDIQTNATKSFNINSYLSFGKVVGFSTLIALIDIVLVTALATLGAYLYNVASGLVGGLELTLADES
jgi:hypothetical protein